MPPSDAGRAALAHLDAALGRKPEKDGHLLSAALRALAEMRDGVIRSHRQAPSDLSRLVLDHVNACVSVVMAAQYPLGEVQWAELERTRGTLAGLVESDIWS